MRGFHKPTVFTVLVIVVVLFLLYHFLVKSGRKGGESK
jgi:hypothetical protein